MKKLFKFFAEKHLLANLISLMILLIGISTVLTINRSQLPNVDLGFMLINTVYPGASPEDVELNVTNKLEESLKTVNGIKKILSASRENVSMIYIEIDTDEPKPQKVKDKIREAVNRVTDLPVEVTDRPLVIEGTSALFPIIDIGITGDVPYKELREHARLFEKKLKDLQGVSEVKRYGYRAREIKIEVDPKKIEEYQMPLREIMTQIKARNIRSSGGSLESYSSEKNLVTLAQFRDPYEVGDVILRSSFGGPSVLVKDLAIIKDDYEDEKVFPRMMGEKGISLEVVKKEKSDIIRTVNAIKKLIDEEQKILPENVKFVVTYDMSKYVKSMFQVVVNNGLIGLILVILVLTLFLNIRSAFWVSMGIPFSLLTAIILLPLFNVDLDMVTLISLVLVIGIIVDDAIIVSENIFQKREQGLEPLDAVVVGLSEVYKPVIVTVLTTNLVFIPMFFMKGMLGKFVYTIPLTICLALTASLFESLFILPAHILPGLNKRQKTGKESGRVWFNPVKKFYENFMNRVLKFRYLCLLCAVIIAGGAIFYAANFMQFVLFPTKGADLFYILVETPKGSSLKNTSDKIKEIEEIIASLPKGEVYSYLSRIGEYSDDMIGEEGENFASIYINLTPYSSRTRTADQIVEELREKTNKLSGFDNIVYYVDGGGPPTGKPIELRVVGADDELRKKLGDDIVKYLENYDGIKDINRSDKKGKDQIEVVIDYKKLARLGLTVADVADNVRVSYDGQVVTKVRYGEEDTDFRLLLKEDARKKESSVENLLIPNYQGRMIKLSEVAKLVYGSGTTMINHYENERSITVTADIKKINAKAVTTPGKVTEDIVKNFDLMKDYPGIRLKVGGEAEESENAWKDLMITFSIAILAIYFLLVLLFNSLAQPLMVMIAIPFGVVGIIIAFAVHNAQLGFLGMIGLIGMAGVVVNDSLVMVDHLNMLTKGNNLNAEEYRRTIAKGASNRLRSIILTTVTTVFGMIPLVYGIGGENVFMQPMALALGYGLLFATPVTLMLVPSLYMIGYDIKNLFRKKKV